MGPVTHNNERSDGLLRHLRHYLSITRCSAQYRILALSKQNTVRHFTGIRTFRPQRWPMGRSRRQRCVPFLDWSDLVTNKYFQ